MTEEANNKPDQPGNGSGRETGETNQSGRRDKEHSGQQKDRTDDTAQKRPTQGGHDIERDEQGDQDESGQRRAS